MSDQKISPAAASAGRNMTRAQTTGLEAKAGIRKWMDFYNAKRPHSALGGQPPAVWPIGNETKQPNLISRC
jgi:transposase InsO family protein